MSPRGRKEAGCPGLSGSCDVGLNFEGNGELKQRRTRSCDRAHWQLLWR
jgi:hypothetical protein